ncbi:hypothetical protein [Nocardioides aurantiacus]|uniref:Uncharacterized protein n=1 Tax=Nocardioides aurantiacus TaxID=86796 RepID=A0A3N2CU64_9ACTN|nr:hypothetical protein [Nocardioides aurantiacus]ROR90948.1 hypothetical protein EDD33_1805 [Nocardioides aurantiacus]
MTVFWIIVAVTCVGLVFLAVRERRAGRRVSPDAIQQRRDDTFRMRTGADYYQSSMPKKDPNRR